LIRNTERDNAFKNKIVMDKIVCKQINNRNSLLNAIKITLNVTASIYAKDDVE